MAFPFGGAISAIGSIAGSLIGASASKKNNAATIANAALDREFQKEFAQQGIGWRVEDAKKAGIHPLYAMGASIPAFSPSPINLSGGGELGQGLAKAGQDIGNAVNQYTTKQAAAPLLALQIDRAKLENALLEKELLDIKPPGTAPGIPLPSAVSAQAIPGQPQGGSTYQVNPAEITASAPNQPHYEGAAVSDAGWTRGADGGLYPVPSVDVKERIEDQLIPEGSWAIRNYGMPFLDPEMMDTKQRRPSPALFPTYPGFEWKWDKWKMGYFVKRIPRKSKISRSRLYKSGSPQGRLQSWMDQHNISY